MHQTLCPIIYLLILKVAVCYGCGGVLSDFHGWIESPQYPNNYPVRTTCRWNISAPRGYRIRIKFVEFELEEHSQYCDYDSVNITDPNGLLTINENQDLCSTPIVTTAESILHCGTPDSDGPKGPIVSTGNNLIVTFRSDHSETHRGFRAYYEVLDVDECVEPSLCSQLCYNFIGGFYCSCKPNYVHLEDNRTCSFDCEHRVLSVGADQCGEITSPEYPEIYPDFSNCDWTINVPVGNQITITFEELDIESQDTCSYDKIELSLGDSKASFCGSSLPEPVSSRSNQIGIKFISDGSDNSKGFRLSYCARELDCGDPGVPRNGSRIGDYFKYGDVVSYQCDRGYQLSGSRTLQCEASGRWSALQPTCQRVSCGNPGNPAHGKTVLQGGVERSHVYQDIIKSTCNEFYERASGDSTRLCAHTGTWTGQPLTCKPKCGERTYYSRGQIFGGEAVPHGTYPWMVSINTVSCTPEEICIFCGGTILNEKYVLTAAHCLPPQRRQGFVMRIGVHKQRQRAREELECKSKIISIHPGYVKETFAADVAVIEIDYCTSTVSRTRSNEIVFSRYIRPICLPEESDDERTEEGERVRVAGWGQKENSKLAIILRHVKLPVAPTIDCQNHFKQQRWKIEKDMFCTLGVKGRDTCKGDSGGPVMARRDHTRGKFIVLGIVSWGDETCGTGYSVYAKVTDYVQWIKQTSKYID